MRTPHNERLSADIADAGPVRTCVLSGREAARDALIRLALAPADDTGAHAVLPDVLARAPGRGAWIGVGRAELEIALTKGKLKAGLMRAFGRYLAGAPLTIPADLPERIEAALLRAFTDRLGLELRAGRLVLGSERIAEQARSGRIAWLAHASDAGEDGNRKLDQAFRVGRDSEGSGEGGVVLPLDRAGLSVALGRDNVVHLALSDRAAAARLALPLGRLLHYLGHPQAARDALDGPQAAELASEAIARLDDIEF